LYYHTVLHLAIHTYYLDYDFLEYLLQKIAWEDSVARVVCEQVLIDFSYLFTSVMVSLNL